MARDISEVQRQTILEQQQKNWPKTLALAKEGNPFATLCVHCYGRHSPPINEICPHDPPKQVTP